MLVKPLTLRFLLALLLLPGLSQVNAQDAPNGAAAQSLAAVRRAAEGQLRRELDSKVTGVKFTAAELDTRLRVAACPTPLVTTGKLPRGTQARVHRAYCWP